MTKGLKTDGFNLLACAVALIQHYGGPLPEVDPHTFALLVIGGNFILRRFTIGPPKFWDVVKLALGR